MSALPECLVCVPCVCLFRVQKRTYDPLELQLGMAVSHMWVLGAKPMPSARATSPLDCCLQPSSPPDFICVFGLQLLIFRSCLKQCPSLLTRIHWE